MKSIKLIFAMITLCFATLTIAKTMKGDVSKYESVVLTFANGSHMLSSEEITKLKTAIANAKTKGEVTRVEVAAWSDKVHPVTGNLPRADRRLAEKRIETIKQDLKQDGLHKYARAYNMAENAHMLGRNLHSSEVELDAVFAKKDKKAIVREDFQLIKEEGAPSKAVVIFRVLEK